MIRGISINIAFIYFIVVGFLFKSNVLLGFFRLNCEFKF
jgi:hypothetical protein